MKLAELIVPNTKALIEPLHKAFMKLSDSEQCVLMIMAVVYKPIGLTKLHQLIDILVATGFLPLLKKNYYLSLKQKEQWINKRLLLGTKDGLHVPILLANHLMANIENLPNQSAMGKAIIAHDHQKRPPKLLTIIMAAEQVVPIVNSYSWQNKAIDKRRMIRDCFYLRQAEKIETALALHKNPQIIDHSQNRILVELFFLPFHLETFLSLPNNVQYQAFATLIRIFQIEGQAIDYPLSLLEQVCAAHPLEQSTSYNVYCQHLLAEQYLYQLRFDEFLSLPGRKDKSAYGLQLLGLFHFVKGENHQSLEYFEQALIAKNKVSKRKYQYLNDIFGYFYKLALLVEANQGNASCFAKALDQISFEENDRKVNSDFLSLGQGLTKAITSLSTGVNYAVEIRYNSVSERIDYFCHQLLYMNYLLAQIWCNQAKDHAFDTLALTYKANFERLSYPLFAKICDQMAAYFSQTSPEPNSPNGANLVNFSTLIKSKSKWDVALDKLIALRPNSEPNPLSIEQTLNTNIRLVWELTHNYTYSLQAREQKRNTQGWSKGRVISLKRLKETPDDFAYLSDTDKRLCSTIASHPGWGYYAKTEYSLQGLSALVASVGIDNLYEQGELDHPIELYQGEPELLVTQQGSELCLSIADLPEDFSDISGQQATYNMKHVAPRKFQLTVFSADHIKVAEIIGEGGLLIPISAKQKALDGISAIAPFLNIQSDIAELDTGLENHDCDRNLVINIQPTKTGLAFTCMVMPFGENGPALIPGIGNASLTSDVNDKRLATQRDLVHEELLMDQLDEHCPAFLAMSSNSLILDDLQLALNALQQLEAAIAIKAFPLLLRWPKGKKISLGNSIEAQHIHFTVSKQSEWFDISGNLHVNDSQVIELGKLLALVKTSHGRFIQLDNEQILSLSSDLRHKLDLLNNVTDEGKFHPLASLWLEEATTGMRMKTIHAWDQQTQKMHQANSIDPVVPSTFQGTLRDYQIQGYEWASRLAHWGAGACLADDMGLGKTLQALALILSRANDGPSLVIAPTSVCFNWQQEALKFSPTLNIKWFSDASDTEKRQLLLNDLGPFDCVILSYGLLQREADMLKKVSWRTIIADEAQALKNPSAKRTKAAYALKSDFKMITTGTPIENDLTELWSLFRFINPGLLGNLKRFGQRFAVPIENAKDNKLAAHKARQGLRTLIQPFILRRMKNQVLTELPPRTDITIAVHMSPKEQAFYEALRINAINNISQSHQPTNAGEQRIRMLAELIKLRQACCHPNLVLPECNIPSSKLAALDELLTELKLNNHKALIFSQFVGHLQIIKQHLDTKGFSYQYLDGATPQKERQKRVNAFQSGIGDVFLISLKAGGFGLNLTAADYVIHMDPWWNPAVEEQASDRAHRMGQTRPVTIYRLITQNTIEQKIVGLHQHKRDLADNLLSGNDTVVKLSVEDMLNLLQETL